MVTKRFACRICGQGKLYDFFDLGPMPAANTLVANTQALEPEFPLIATVCLSCQFVQLKHVVSPDVLFRHYQYMSSASPSYLSHFDSLASTLIGDLLLAEQSLVIDIGSNDGSLLKKFAKRKMKVLGVDPAKNLADLANKEGIETTCDYFTPELAQHIVSTKGHAKLITATNVFAHVDDLTILIGAIDMALDHDGVFCIQFSYLGDLLENNAFDTIYHEHLSYFSIASLIRLFANSPLEMYAVEKIPIHGGSLRIFVRKKGRKQGISKTLRALLQAEAKLDLNTKTVYRTFAQRANRIKENLVALLDKLANEKKIVVGLGAPAKGITLINFAGLTPNHIRYITDSTPAKHGHFTPRSRIPIVPERTLKDNPIDYAIIFAWNFADEIMRKTSFIRKKGGKYIIPIPNVTII